MACARRPDASTVPASSPSHAARRVAIRRHPLPPPHGSGGTPNLHDLPPPRRRHQWSSLTVTDGAAGVDGPVASVVEAGKRRWIPWWPCSRTCSRYPAVERTPPQHRGLRARWDGCRRRRLSPPPGTYRALLLPLCHIRRLRGSFALIQRMTKRNTCETS